LKRQAALAAVLAVQMVFSSSAAPMTIKELKLLKGDDAPSQVLAETTVQKLENRKHRFPAQAQCLDDLFFKVSTNSSGKPDGIWFIDRQIEKVNQIDPERQVEDVISRSIEALAKHACSSSEEGKRPKEK